MRTYILDRKMNRDTYFDIMNWIKETDREMNGELLKREVTPYGYKIPMGELLKDDYDDYTPYSQEMMNAEIVGLIPIVNYAVKEWLEPKVAVRFRNGDVSEVTESFAEKLIEWDVAERI